MLDFFEPWKEYPKRGLIEVIPKFKVEHVQDLLIRGGDFYAAWNEDRKMWTTDEIDVVHMIDRALLEYAEEVKKTTDDRVTVKPMWDNDSGSMTRWRNYCKKNMRDNAREHPLDDKLIFADTETKREDYATKRLSYSLSDAEPEAWNTLIGTLYSDTEKHKIEWAIGSIVNGDSRYIQKFCVFYGNAGTGKSTVLNIIQDLFKGYVSVFDAKALGQATNAFALESLANNPLVAIQHDGDLSKIEDNTKLNSVVSHETMPVNAKYEKVYSQAFRCFLFMGTNKPVRITDAKSGLIRRLIDISPTGEKVEVKTYHKLLKQIGFELGAIANRCRKVYEEDPHFYDSYIPSAMMSATNDVYMFIQDNWYDFISREMITLKEAWPLYQAYCEDSNVLKHYNRREFGEELKNYFKEFYDRYPMDDGKKLRSVYKSFDTAKFEPEKQQKAEAPPKPIFELNKTKSLVDILLKDCPAQYATEDGKPVTNWDNCATTLGEIDTTRLHYVRVPENHIVIDFDIPGPDGKKDRKANLEEAAKFPQTYAEYSKSGGGVHLHYIYKGDVTKLSRIYAPHIEVKVYTGKSSLRRQLSCCNDIPVREISSGLPLKEDINTIDVKSLKNEKHLRCLVLKALRKEGFPGTRCAIDFIDRVLTEAQKSGLHYDLSDLEHDIFTFAQRSSNQAPYCMKKCLNMQLIFSEPVPDEYDGDAPIVFYDIEVFPNLLLVNWKKAGENEPVHREINPSPAKIAELSRYRLVGFNCRRYDNHIMYARLRGESIEDLYERSYRIIHKDKTAFISNAYNFSYTDVYDFSTTKQSLKKFEIDLHIHHKELGLPWDKPVPEELWERVAEYCDNDVIATEAVFNDRKSDFEAREMLAAISGLTVNDTTNSHTARMIVGEDRNPQKYFIYRDLAQPVTPGMWEERQKLINR